MAREPIPLSVLVGLSLAALVVAPWLGPTPLAPLPALASWWAQTTGGIVDDPVAAQILALRIPRVLLGWLAGATLAITGGAFQGLFRNPLATPYTTGVAAAASLGAATVVLVAGSQTALHHLWTDFGVTGGAFTLALAETALVAGLAARTGGLRTEALLLAGVTLNFVATALILLLRSLTDAPLQLLYLDRWLMGGLDVVGWEWLPLAPIWGVGMAGLLTLAPALDQLAVNQDLAAGRGVRVERTTAAVLILATAATAAVVAAVGPIGFVGLVVPNGVRRLLGAGHLRLLLGSLVTGGGFLVLCDGAVRLLAAGRAGGELPVGVLTALIGGPLFLIVLVRTLGGPR